MVDVHQGVQHRYFMYDSLGRMLRLRQPEQEVNTALNTSGNPDNNSWTAGFTYDNNGNVLTATDAKGTTTTNTYDVLNRVTQRSYNDTPQTPTVTFTYDDQNVPHSKGKLTQTSNSVSTSKTTNFDLLGMPLNYQQITNGEIYNFEYKYNLSGGLIEEIYPSGRIVKNFIETDGDLTAVSSRVPNSEFRNYASNFSYTAAGGISAFKYGNGRWETSAFNARHQIVEASLGTTPTNKNLWNVVYSYGELSTDGSTVDATKNDGNIAKQTMTIGGLSHPFIQTNKYDTLNRLVEAKETNNGNQTWIQTFGYDRYGNRTSFSQTIGGQQLTLNNLTHPSIDANSNRFSASQGYLYDSNGNLIENAEGDQFTFDGNNKQKEVKDDQDNVIGQYFYDGDGKRVKKVTTNETVIFVFSGAKLVAEYSTAAPAQSPNTYYTTNDYLGSPRIVSDKMGNVVSRRDFLPFGEELPSDSNYRLSTSKFGTSDGIRQKFTGYLKDSETGLDFAEARMYKNQHARFTAIDPLLASGKSDNPQTFNRFVYAGNNPILRADPTGEDWIIAVHKERVGKKEVSVERPYWVPKGDVPSGIQRAPNIWEVNLGGSGFQALDPNNERSSGVFKTREEAQTQLDAWSTAETVTNSSLQPESGTTFGYGWTGGGSAAFGLMGGGSASVDGFFGNFYNSGRNVKFVTGGGIDYGFSVNPPIAGNPGVTLAIPPPENMAITFGRFAGAGLGMFFTNAGSPEQLRGPFFTRQLNTPIGGAQFSTASDGTRVLSVTVGPGIGGSYWQGTTNTVASPSLPRPPVTTAPFFVPVRQ